MEEKDRDLEETKNADDVSQISRTRLKYLIGSWGLYDSFFYCPQVRKNGPLGLLSDEPEWMHYASGVVCGNIRTVERIVTFSFSQQTPAFVKGDPMSTRDVLIRMAEFGYPLHVVCHSHPGCGEVANMPSGTDIDHQTRLERGGYSCISCIYSRDGHIRFFSVDLPFEVEIFGEGVKQVGRTTFHLTEIA